MKLITKWLFAPGAPCRLGWARLIFFTALFVMQIRIDGAAWADVPTVFWRPIQLFTRHFDPAWLSRAWLEPLRIAMLAALICAAIGFRTKLATGVGAVLLLFFAGLPQNFGKVNHDDAILTFVAFAFFASHCGRVLSVDAWLARRRGDVSMQLSPEEAGWPLRLIHILWALVFFAAGFAKLTRSGLEWAFSDNMRTMLLQHHFHHLPPTSLGLLLADARSLAPWVGAASIFLELSAPLALLGRSWSLVIVGGLFSMQLAIFLTMGVLFEPFFAIYLMWLPYGRAKLT